MLRRTCRRARAPDLLHSLVLPCLATLVLVELPLPARAAEGALEPVVVTGAREPVALRDALQDVTVIDRATIESYSGSSLETLLADQAGVQVATSGGLGSLSSVFLRGANSDSTLLLIDGVRYGSATAGGPVLYNLPLLQIDHIEIVRGPLSSLYGSDAAGGVIQIFTRRGEPGFAPSADATVGSEGYGLLDAGLRGGANGLDYAVLVGGQRTDGYPFTNPQLPYGNFNPNNDGFSQQSISANVGYAWADGWSLRLLGLGSRGNVQFADGFDPTRPDLTARSRVGTAVDGIQLQGRVTAQWSTRLHYGASRDDYDTDLAVQSYDLGRFTNRQQQAQWQNDITTPIGTVLASVEQLRQSVDSDAVAFPIDHRTVNGILLGVVGHAGAHGWQADVRSDVNSEFGHIATGAASYGWQFAPTWRLTISAGTSFVMPSFDDLYYPGYGNPSLLPQRGESTEIGLDWKEAGQSLRVLAYDSRFHDLIALNTDYYPVNIGQSRIRGLTVEYGGRIGPVTLGASADYLDPADLTDGTELPHRAREVLSANADWNVSPDWSAGVRLHTQGTRYDDTANQQPLGGFGLVSLAVQWHVLRGWHLALRVDNAADHSYSPAYGYNGPPRQVFLSLRYAGS